MTSSSPPIPGLEVYIPPVAGYYYVIGADPAQGNPTSDDSALTVLAKKNGEEVASLAGKFEPATFAAHIDQIGRWFNNAAVMVERNNHGWAVLQWLRDYSPLELLRGHDGQAGWLTNVKSKSILYDTSAEMFRDGETILHSFKTYTQLCSIEGATLRAPEGQMDDRAIAFCMALVGIAKSVPVSRPIILHPGMAKHNPYSS